MQRQPLLRRPGLPVPTAAVAVAAPAVAVAAATIAVAAATVAVAAPSVAVAASGGPRRCLHSSSDAAAHPRRNRLRL